MNVNLTDEPSSITSFSQNDLAILLNDEERLIQMCNECRLLLSSSPTQSNFRVYAFLFIETPLDGLLHLVHGTNAEPGYIGGSICAERSALVKLRFFTNPKIIKVIITTDLNEPLSPGMLCREYLSALASPSTPIIMASANGDKISKCLLGQLHPSPYIYRQQVRNNITLFAKNFAKNLIDPSTLNENASNLYKKAIEFTKYDNTDNIHPIRLAAAVLFSNGNIDIAWQMKGLEYGCTLCPVAQLIHSMEKYRVCGTCRDFTSNNDISTFDNNSRIDLIDNNMIKPIMIAMVDQHGICHAPFAQCRALLNEYYYGEVEFIVHNELNGIPELIKSISLSPPPPNGKLLTHDDFDKPY